MKGIGSDLPPKAVSIIHHGNIVGWSQINLIQQNPGQIPVIVIIETAYGYRWKGYRIYFSIF